VQMTLGEFRVLVDMRRVFTKDAQDLEGVDF
jgi:hypothetical protein